MAGKKPLTVPSLMMPTARVRLNFLPWWLSSARMSAMPITARAERPLQRLHHGLEEQLVLALEVAVDHAFADPAVLGDHLDRGAVHVAGLGERAPGGLQDGALPGRGGQAP